MNGRERFAGRACLVTGGGRGIGRAIALAIAAEGGRVAVAARTADQVEQTARDIDGLAVVADLARPDDAERAVSETVAAIGPPTVVIVAAGISPVRKPAEAYAPGDFGHIVEVNLVAAFNVARAVAPSLLSCGGSVVMIASSTAERGSPRLAGYAAAKAGMAHLARTLAREWADRGVRVNAVMPGYVETAMTHDLLAVDHHHAAIVADTPLGRIADVEEVVAPVLFLASDEASYITGATLRVDGGMAA